MLGLDDIQHILLARASALTGPYEFLSFDDPELGCDPLRNNDFNFKEMDPHGYTVALGPTFVASNRVTPQ